MKNTKRSTIAIWILMILLLFPAASSILNAAPSSPRPMFFVEASTGLLLPAQASFREIYASSILFPRFRMGVHLSRNLFIFGGYGFMAADGLTPQWNLSTRMKQSLISLGAGYVRALSSRIDMIASIGAVRLHYSEEIPELSLTHSNDCLGFILDLGLGYRLSRNFDLRAGFIYQNTKDSEGEKPVSLGGCRIHLGLAFRF